MKNIEVTYTAQVLENGKCEEGEAAFILPMTDGLAECYLTGVGMNRGAICAAHLAALCGGMRAAKGS